MTVTVRDVAQAAGVSQATAARALGGYGYASGPARERVLESARLLGYTPNAVARALVSNATMTVGVVVGDIDNPFFATAARGLTDVFDGHGYTVLLANADENHEREGRVLDALRSRRVDGLVVVPAPGAQLDQIVSSGLPVVQLDRAVRGLAADAVMVENSSGAERAVAHLLGLGHRRIGIVSDTAGISSSAERIAGYRRALRRGGGEVSDELVAIGGSTQADAPCRRPAAAGSPGPAHRGVHRQQLHDPWRAPGSHRTRALDPAGACAGGFRRPRLDDAGEAAADSRLPAGLRTRAGGRRATAGPHRRRRLTAAAGAAADPADRARLLRSARVSDVTELLAQLVAADSTNPTLVPGGVGEAEVGASWPSGWSGQDSRSTCGMPLPDGRTWSAACAAVGADGR